MKSKLLLERVLGLTCGNNASFAVNPATGELAYAAGSVVVVYNLRRNKQTRYYRVEKSVSCVAFSRDGSYLAIGEKGFQPSVTLWNCHQGRIVGELQLHKYGIACLAFSANSRLLLTAGLVHDQKVFAWDLTHVLQKDHQAENPDGEPTLPGPNNPMAQAVCVGVAQVEGKIFAMDFNAEGNFFVTAGEKAHLGFWFVDSANGSAASAKMVTTGMKPAFHEEFPQLQMRNAVLPTQKQADFTGVACGQHGDARLKTFAITSDGILCCFGASGVLERIVSIEASCGFAICVSEAFVAVAGSSSIVRLFDPVTLTYRATLPFPPALGKANEPLANSTSGVLLAPPQPHRYASAIALRLTGSHLAVVYGDHSLFVYDLETTPTSAQVFRSFLFHSGCIRDLQVVGQVKGVNSKGKVVYHPTKTRDSIPDDAFVTCSDDNTLRIWHLEANKPRISRKTTTANSASSIAPDIFRNPFSQEMLYLHYHDKQQVFDDDRNHLLLGGTCGSETAPDIHTPSRDVGFHNGLRAVAVHCDKHLLAIGDKEGIIEILDVPTMKPIKEFGAHNSEVTCLAFDHEQRLVSGGRDRLMHVYDSSKEFQVLQTIENHSSAVASVTFDRKNNKLISCGADKHVVFSKIEESSRGGKITRLNSIPMTGGKVFDMILASDGDLVWTSCNNRLDGFSTTSCKHIRGFHIGEQHHFDLSAGNYCAAMSGSLSEKAIHVVDLKSGDTLAEASGHGEAITAIKFLPDCRRIVSCSSDSCIFVWRIPEDIQQAIKARLPLAKDVRTTEKLPMPTVPTLAPEPVVNPVQDTKEILLPPPPPMIPPLKAMGALQAVRAESMEGKQTKTTPRTPLSDAKKAAARERILKELESPRSDAEEIYVHKKPVDPVTQMQRTPDADHTIMAMEGAPIEVIKSTKATHHTPPATESSDAAVQIPAATMPLKSFQQASENPDQVQEQEKIEASDQTALKAVSPPEVKEVLPAQEADHDENTAIGSKFEEIRRETILQGEPMPSVERHEASTQWDDSIVADASVSEMPAEPDEEFQSQKPDSGLRSPLSIPHEPVTDAVDEWIEGVVQRVRAVHTSWASSTNEPVASSSIDVEHQQPINETEATQPEQQQHEEAKSQDHHAEQASDEEEDEEEKGTETLYIKQRSGEFHCLEIPRSVEVSSSQVFLSEFKHEGRPSTTTVAVPIERPNLGGELANLSIDESVFENLLLPRSTTTLAQEREQLAKRKKQMQTADAVATMNNTLAQLGLLHRPRAESTVKRAVTDASKLRFADSFAEKYAEEDMEHQTPSQLLDDFGEEEKEDHGSDVKASGSQQSEQPTTCAEEGPKPAVEPAQQVIEELLEVCETQYSMEFDDCEQEQAGDEGGDVPPEMVESGDFSAGGFGQVSKHASNDEQKVGDDEMKRVEQRQTPPRPAPPEISRSLDLSAVQCSMSGFTDGYHMNPPSDDDTRPKALDLGGMNQSLSTFTDGFHSDTNQSVHCSQQLDLKNVEASLSSFTTGYDTASKSQQDSLAVDVSLSTFTMGYQTQDTSSDAINQSRSSPLQKVVRTSAVVNKSLDLQTMKMSLSQFTEGYGAGCALSNDTVGGNRLSRSLDSSQLAVSLSTFTEGYAQGGDDAEIVANRDGSGRKSVELTEVNASLSHFTEGYAATTASTTATPVRIRAERLPKQLTPDRSASGHEDPDSEQQGKERDPIEMVASLSELDAKLQHTLAELAPFAASRDRPEAHEIRRLIAQLREKIHALVVAPTACTLSSSSA